MIDATALTATYYVNGVAQPPITINTGVTSSGGTITFRVGSSSTGGVYDIDEFRLSARAAAAAEILAWTTRTSAADSRYGAGCNGGSLTSTGGTPKLGNATYALTLGGTAGSAWMLSLGASRVSLGAIPLPFNLGLLFPSMAGCNWESSADLILNGTLSGATTNIPLPIPVSTVFEGVTVWTQGLLVGPTLSIQSTNGFAIGIGN